MTGAAPGTAEWVVEPPTAEVGQPVTWRLRIEHELGARFDWEGLMDSFEAGLDGSWTVFDRSGVLTRPVEGDPERARSTVEWTVASLEPGVRELPGLTFTVAGETIEIVPATLEVRGVLSEGADTHRPAIGFREPAEPSSSSFVTALPIAGMALFLIGVLWMWRRRGARPAKPAPARPADRLRSRLEAWRSAAPRTPNEIRDVHYELSELLRSGVDDSLGEDRRGLTDEEWIADLERRQALSESMRADLARLLEAAGGIKYGGAAPSPWAVEEHLAAAERFRAQLEEARP